MTTTINDKNKTLNVSLQLINQKLNFKGEVSGNPPISIDYIPPLGDNLGYTSLELFLLSFSSCLGSAMLTFLRRMGKNISSFNIYTVGVRHEEHPTGFKEIMLEIQLTSGDTISSEVEKVIALAKEKYCPVWAMLDKSIIVSYEVILLKG